MSIETFRTKRGDTSRKFTRTLDDEDGDAIDLSNAASVTFVMGYAYPKTVPSDPSPRSRFLKSPQVEAAATITDAASGAVEYAFAAADVEDEGEFNAEWEIEWNDGSVQTVPHQGYDRVVIEPDMND